jgi:hypothetical protein
MTTIDEKIAIKKAQIEKYKALIQKKESQIARIEKKKVKAMATAQAVEDKAKAAGLPAEEKPATNPPIYSTEE